MKRLGSCSILSCGALVWLVNASLSAQSTSIAVSRMASSSIQIPSSTALGILKMERRLAQVPPAEVTSWKTLEDLVLGLNRLGFPTTWDDMSAEEVGVTLKTELPRVYQTTSWHSYLMDVLRSSGLTYIWDDKKLAITTPERAEVTTHVVVYDVTEICFADDTDSLIDRVQSNIEPDSWDDVGGEGSIGAYVTPSGRVLLIVSQNVAVQREVRVLVQQIGTIGGGAVAGSLMNRPAQTRRGTATAGSTSVALPARSKRRGIATPGSGISGGFGGGMGAGF